MAQIVKNLAAMQETCVLSLGREDPLKEEMATDSSILAWRIPSTEEPGGLQSMGQQTNTIDRLTHIHTAHTQVISKSRFITRLGGKSPSILGLREDESKKIVDRYTNLSECFSKGRG